MGNNYMKQYGKLTNNHLITPKSIDLGDGQWITNPTDEQYIAHGYKLVNRSEFPNYSFMETYEETETEITVIYAEVITPDIWYYNTAIKVKMNSDRFVAMVSEVNAIVPDVSRNVSNFGITEIYLDVIDDEFRTLVTYFDENVIITERI